MKLLLLVGTGSFIGGVLRYSFSQFIQNRFLGSFPIGTLGVNITGCLLIGFVFGIIEKGNLSTEWKLFLATGILGGFTTFSAFSHETISLIREGQLFLSLTYIASSVCIALGATTLGILAVKFI